MLRDGETVEFEDALSYPSLGQRSIQMVIAPTFDPAGVPDGWVAVITDHTNRRALEQALRLSEERYRSLVGVITSVVWTSNATGEIVEPQPAWEAYTGQTWAQHQGRGWVEAIHPDDRGQIAAGLGDAMRTGAFGRVPMRLWHAASNDYRFCETGGVAIRNPDGSIREWIGTVVDVHERELALRELKEADRRKDEFLAMLSHELRNPLAPILSAVEILRLVDQRDAEMSATYRTVIAQQVQHMKRLLDDLLDVSRVSQGKIELRREPLDLGAILLQAVEVSRPLITEKKQQLSVTKPPAPVLLDADPTRLVQVFANLLNNAAKYADHGGHIALEMSTDRGEALVRVRDDGVGMSPDLLETRLRSVRAGDALARPRAGRAGHRPDDGAQPGQDARRVGARLQRRPGSRLRAGREVALRAGLHHHRRADRAARDRRGGLASAARAGGRRQRGRRAQPGGSAGAARSPGDARPRRPGRAGGGGGAGGRRARSWCSSTSGCPEWTATPSRPRCERRGSIAPR